MKILFLGDYSNLHACLAAELRRRGENVTVVSDGGRFMDTKRDITIERKPGRLGALNYLYSLFSLLPKLSGYDVVQLINPQFFQLRPGKTRYFFDRIKNANGSVFCTLAGNDYHFVDACINSDMFKYSEFRIGNTPTEHEQATHRAQGWLRHDMKRYADYVYEKLNGAMSVLPEYDMAARPLLGQRLAFTNIPIDLSSLPFAPLESDGPVSLFVGMQKGRELEKGTKRLLEMALRLEQEMPGKCKAVCASGLPLHEYLERMRQSHIVLDQLYSYSPGTNAFQAMALGRVAATGAQPEYYDYIGQGESHPLISLSPLIPESELEEQFRSLILAPEKMQNMAAEGRKIVERDNDVRIVAAKFQQHWQKILNNGHA